MALVPALTLMLQLLTALVPVVVIALVAAVLILIPEPAPARYLLIPMWVLEEMATALLPLVWLISPAASQPSPSPTKAARLPTAQFPVRENAGWTEIWVLPKSPPPTTTPMLTATSSSGADWTMAIKLGPAAQPPLLLTA